MGMDAGLDLPQPTVGVLGGDRDPAAGAGRLLDRQRRARRNGCWPAPLPRKAPQNMQGSSERASGQPEDAARKAVGMPLPAERRWGELRTFL
jgi:hypothetical protein